jgi:D-alanyl-D-alanine carboxypeptidase
VYNEKFQSDIKEDPDRTWKPEELLAYVFDEEPLFAPGTDFSYSDTNYIVLGMILENVTGTTLYNYIDQNILVPNHLENVIPQTNRKIDKLISGYSSENDEFFPGKVAEDGTYKYNWQFEWAGGGFVVNASDLALSGKLIYEGSVFSEDLLDDFFTGIDAKRLGGQWGLGVHIKESPFGLTYGHSGFFPGYITNMLYFPDLGFSIAFQVNISDSEKIGLYRKMYQIIPTVIELLESY